MEGQTKEELKILIAQKDEMEKEIASLTKQIENIDEVSQFSSGIIDPQGFPRSNLDFGELSNYRNLKRRREELNNDHSALMKEIEKKLFIVFKP